MLYKRIVYLILATHLGSHHIFGTTLENTAFSVEFDLNKRPQSVQR